MPEIGYKDLKKYLSELHSTSEKKPAPVYLIHGEEMLVKTVYDELLDVLIPAAHRSVNYEPIDGAAENIREVIERVNTFALLSGSKVVAIRDSKIFYARKDREKLLENAKAAAANNDLRKAATYFVSLLGHLNLCVDDLSASNRSTALAMDPDRLSDDAWLDDIIAYCQEQHLKIPMPEDDCTVLQKAVEKGFPENNFLIITAESVDKRRGLFKAISQKGMIIDCAIPKGDRRADKQAQEDVMAEKMSTILSVSGKKLDKAAYQLMQEMTGFDLRTFTNNLEKIINYIGERDTITVADVESVIKRSKKDPLYELTNAVSDRDVQRSFFYLASMLSSDFYPLQILAAIINQFRKLLLAKDFIESPSGRNWHAGCTYSRFQFSVMPDIVAYDNELIGYLEKWAERLAGFDDRKAPKATPKGKMKAATDLLIAGQQKNAYPLYQLFLKSERFTTDELMHAFDLLSEADIQLKSTGFDPKLILERAILDICQR